MNLEHNLCDIILMMFHFNQIHISVTYSLNEYVWAFSDLRNSFILCAIQNDIFEIIYKCFVVQ